VSKAQGSALGCFAALWEVSCVEEPFFLSCIPDMTLASVSRHNNSRMKFFFIEYSKHEF
jgi:hypothetical protein